MKDITAQELKSKMDKGEEFFLLDVRQDFEHVMYNIGGTLIPLANLPSSIDEIEEHKDREVIVYCRSGMRSGTAKQILVQQGFKNVRNLLGGVLGWQGEGYIVKGNH